jgi:hypothetical protein
MTLLEKIEYMQKAWKVLLPHIQPPPSEDAARWCNYSRASVEQAMMRTAKRFGVNRIDPATFDVTYAYKYCTSTARSISDHKQSQNDAMRHRR